MKSILVLIFLIGVNLISWSQEDIVLVVEKQATEKQKTLIDELMEVSHFEDYFIEYSSLSIQLEAMKKKWNKDEIAERISKINFTKFKESCIYTGFAGSTESELKYAIKLAKKLNKKAIPPFCFVSNTIVQLDLVLYVRSNYLK